ncbi:hypothetical protein SDRG_12897 [Saprolegnia diclina VS20]|uniref:Uracil-DNA glycosylase-like domain-containing protein n=1 Tax=Saprolegnia diclina (strain VS20) TaxID=1156394 RepID=T0Q7J8_SAPDV|nr:hypothetical protein SDRG_12897 [Saprolegnia diclina VS20]EQC29435.1 hypothetical protein SDRG_12897 [Saprolegnia diclina VS20]|eukprot:XP_008617202.1 hypothetical protein SDRG_12897 [Saprolegnia diclina VS20]
MFDQFRFGAGMKRSVVDEAPSRPAPKKAKPTALVRKWQERYHGICDVCFDTVTECSHHPDVALRLLIVGHNPSENAWQSGFSYSNPSNRMWKLLMGDFHGQSWPGVLPPDWTMADQNAMPHELGVGFSDLGHEPGNDAAAYGKATMQQWTREFYDRMRAHMQRVQANLHATASGDCSSVYAHGPMLVAFMGKRQYTYLFDPPLKKVDTGHQDPSTLPPDWPLPPSCEVWVLPSSSGRAAMTDKARCAPYRDLAARFHAIPWPSPANASCHVIKSEDIKSEDDGACMKTE